MTIWMTFVLLAIDIWHCHADLNKSISDSGIIVVRPMGPLVYNIGSMITVNCSVPGNEYPDVTWQRHSSFPYIIHNVTGVNRRDDQTKYMWTDRYTLQLFVSSAAIEDSGTYACGSQLLGFKLVSILVLHSIPQRWMRTGTFDGVKQQCHHFTCQPTGHCIFSRYRCDQFVNCPDASDEIGCEKGCESGYRCGSGECLHSLQVCDGLRDCADESDEYNCRLSVFQNSGSDDIYEPLGPATQASVNISHDVWHFNALYSGMAALIGLLSVIVIVVIALCRFHHQAMVSSAALYARCQHRLLIAGIESDSAFRGEATIVAPPPYSEAPPPPYSTLERPHEPQNECESGSESTGNKQETVCNNTMAAVAFVRTSRCDDILGDSV